jgi:hypothetical protein
MLFTDEGAETAESSAQHSLFACNEVENLAPKIFEAQFVNGLWLRV